MMNTLLGNYYDGLQYGMAAIRRAKVTQDTAELGEFYTRVGLTYYELNELAKVDEYLRLSLQQAIGRHDQKYARYLAVQIVRNMVVMGRPKQALALMLQVQRRFPPQTTADSVYLATGFLRCYIATKQFKLAAQSCQSLRRQVEELPATYANRIEVYLGIGRFFVATHQYNKAREYLQQTVLLSKNAGYKTILESSYLLLFKADSAQGLATAAIANYQHYKTMHDSIFNERNSKQIAGLQIQYDTKEKEQSIALLTKQSLLQQMTIRQRGFQRNVFLGGTLLMASLLGLGYNRFRLKQRSNQLLEAQQAEIHRKNAALEQVLGEKDQLLEERQELLVEKDWMLKEIHHRVKNNLQVVSSLLSTQSRHLHDPQAVAAIRESQNRVQVMALLHQKLYQADHLGRVNLADYAREIVNYLVESFDRQRSVQVQLELAPIELETTVATPLGLILNEAVTNALKHAFPPPRRGTLTVSLVSLGPQQYQLIITDDGVGLPQGFDLTRSRSLGMVIIKGLSRQLDGQLAVSTAQGACLSLQFDTSKKPVRTESSGLGTAYPARLT
ncbi:sensor histidine kinase [Hymenobacter wooponensis]|nr:histidine kinase dimerization/phosphoacceptor domain -containing protein [Hymenobacter wooponensis]